MRGFIKWYKETTEKKPNFESWLTVFSVCIFATVTSVICKVYFTEEVKNTELVLNEDEREYYEGAYDKAIEAIAKKEEEIFPHSIMKEGIIRSVQGDTLASNSLAEQAYIQSRVAIDTHGYEKYKEDVENLSNDIVTTYLLNNELPKAIEYGEFLLGEYRGNYKLQKALATAYIANGQRDRAIQTLDEIKFVYENSYDLSEIGEIYLSAGEYEKGLSKLRQAYKLDNSNINVLQTLREYSEDKELKSQLKEEKDSVNKMLLSQIEIMSDRDYNKGIEKINSSREESLCKLYLEFQVSKKEEDKKRMEAIIEEVKESYDDTFGGNYILAEYFIQEGDVESATHYANKTIELNEKYGRVYGVLFPEIISLDREAKVDEGAYIREGLIRNPYSVEILKKGAKYYNDLEKFDIAYNYISTIVKIERYDYKNYIEKAMLEEKGRDKSIPSETLKSALLIDPDNGEIYNYLGVTYLKNGENEEGIKNIRKAYEVDKENIKALNNAAVYYTSYEKNISRAYSNIKSANELLKWSTNTKVKETVMLNLSLIEKVHDEVVETDNQNWTLENLELLN
ncbi:MAG: tetratricopeptide repeat protein [Clostridium sp.]|uniref:tetratricopeptide repeat protein n=1 Tax=Clostridium sp. TaxID=1506 RepID=UPI003F2CC293